MKNVSAIKSSKTDSPKTPGGISRSLLTPCRRLGLSRNFRKSGTSPFQSPLSSKTEEKQEEKAETRKRKESLEEPPKTENVECETPSVVQTPTRIVSSPRRKRSKTLLTSINKSAGHNELSQEKITVTVDEDINDMPCKERTATGNKSKDLSKESVSAPVRLKSRNKKKTPSKSVSEEVSKVDLEKENLSNTDLVVSTENNEKTEISNREKEKEDKSPNNLTKECIVVIQKKIFKELNGKSPIKEKDNEIKPKLKDSLISQAVFNDSDSDDVPLSHLNSKETESAFSKNVDEDDDFTTTKTKMKRTSNTRLSNTKSPAIKNNDTAKLVNVEKHKPSNSQSSVDDDDDFEKKKTILIRKNYNKVIKPQKAKSTGSITQKDVDDLKARIEIKKKMLLARAMTEDTKELRDLIKKWQKGCQEALMELMDLMRNKFPEKQNMDYSEILQTLKIPASLVGYDSDNDCFLTPDDESVILANVKD